MRRRLFLAVLGVGALAAATPSHAQLSACRPTCLEKRWSLDVDVNGNGLPDAGDIIEYTITLCQMGMSPGGGPVTCQLSDAIDALNPPSVLRLHEDPSSPGTSQTCTPDDAGMTACTATPGGTTVVTCQTSTATDSFQGQFMMERDACVTVTFWAEIDPALSGAQTICNQSTPLSDDPTTSPAKDDPTCFDTVQPPPRPTITKVIVGCAAPCTRDISTSPGTTSLRYDIVISNNDPGASHVLDVVDDLPLGATGFRVIDRGNGTDCSAPGLPSCTLTPGPGGAHGAGQIRITDLGLGPAGSANGRATITIEVDFSCPPVTAGQIVSNQAMVTTTDNLAICNPCPSDDPGTVSADDETSFSATCAPPPDLTILKTGPTSWKPTDSPVFNYTVTITNNNSTTVALGPTLDVLDMLPADGTGTPQFDPAASCPITVTSSTPPNPITATSSCGTNPNVRFSNFLDLAPLSSVSFTFPITILTTLPDGTQICNLANVGGPLTGQNSTTCAEVQLPQPVDFSNSTKTVAPNPVQEGSDVTLTIVVTNSGTGTGNNVMVSDTIASCFDIAGFDPATTPSQVSVMPGPSGTPTWTPGTRLLTVPITSVAPGTPQTVTVTGIKALTRGLCCNQGFITSDEVAPPGQRTGSTTAPADDNPSCITINPIGVSCDLNRADITFPPITPAKTAPWVYTAGGSCTPPDARVAGVAEQSPFADDTDLTTLASGPGGNLQLFQVTCPCTNRLGLVKLQPGARIHLKSF